MPIIVFADNSLDLGAAVVSFHQEGVEVTYDFAVAIEKKVKPEVAAQAEFVVRFCCHFFPLPPPLLSSPILIIFFFTGYTHLHF